MQIILALLVLVLGFTMLVKGADWFVEGASGIATAFGIPQLVIGLTIVAMGTSAPEAAVSITAALKGSAGITIGNVVGSNILNVLVILGIASSLVPVKVKKSTIRIEIPYLILISLLLMVLGIDGAVALIDGVILWAVFLLYGYYLLQMAKRDKQPHSEQVQPVWKSLSFTVIGLGLIIWGSNLAVDAATTLAMIFGISERFIGLTIVALGTSLPELFTSVVAARKGNADIAIGNIVGSNIFNFLFVVGTSSLITKVPFEPRFLIDTFIAALSVFILWFCVRKRRRLERKHGFFLLACYIVYFVYLCVA